MCDTFVVRAGGRTLLAKNSDRDPNEPQLWEWTPAADHAAGATARATYVEVPQVAHTHATVVSRPWWMWGAEMGANEHGVAIGNEAVFTTQRASLEPGLLGMDLLRLALERATTAREAVGVIVALLEEHGQSGRCSHEHRRFTYHNSFLVADPEHAIVLETAGRAWATEDVRGRARSISNGLTIPGFAEQHTDRLRSRISSCAVRRELTEGLAEDVRGVVGAMGVLRQNGTGLGPRWSPVNGSMVGPNMHAGGLLASGQTTASWVSDLGSGIHWATGTSDPAFSLFVPLRVDQPVAEADYVTAGVTNRRDDRSLWWRHEELHRRALRDWLRAERVVATDRDRLQRAWVSEPPAAEEALAEVRLAHERWLPAVRQVTERDARPWWVRQRWAGFDRAAGR
ncbi:carcinine hydrolase/isopenicillin-N N-acyltransferase family protein [Nocardioides mangrovi]|uniref:Carcinine hydrolase/isopenicillin-N N-acyltransferase family protein n=1 Tax=Nocardioides mangrovi TaxID=2874580 RepID=A0ABS7UEK7_9ACTN|nr:carcinine hydrolase/isopenicillin-N N-acyltransferase family protein [Nocardioides mangrovi]MBZ5739131.1 carcinine hydrolase/isopenicillin-N N-acyltransferase family protein [Nocardioides mangrovi]